MGGGALSGIRVSVIDDLPQLAASSAELRIQRLAQELGPLAGLQFSSATPLLAGLAKAALARRTEELRARVALTEYELLGDALGADRSHAQAILRMAQQDLSHNYGYREPGPPTVTEIDHATVLLRALAPAMWNPAENREKERLARLSERATATLARSLPSRPRWPCACQKRQAGETS
jgi:hypothetical protein